MAKIESCVTQLDENRFRVDVDATLYAKEAIVATLYKYTEKYYIHQQTKDNFIEIIFENKAENIVTAEIAKQFCNDLIDQQVRYNTEQQFGHIRDLIVEEAFKPVNK